MPDSYAMAPDGLLLIANGINPMLRWDGYATDAAPAGVIAPSTGPTLTSSGAGALSGTYYAYLRFVDESGNVSDLSPLSGPLVLSSALTLTYSSVALPTQSKVARRQLLRNTNGQTNTFYVDVDTSDLTSTTFTSTLSDTLLQANAPQAIFDHDGSPLANAHGVPPSSKAVVAHHLDRMFASGEVEYKEGCVALTVGSASVSGVGTEWPSTFQGRFLWASGADKPYEISSVDVSNQSITLTEPYGGGSDSYATYAIRPPLGERRLVYYTEAGQPESWPAVNAISLQEDGDEIVGLMAKGSFIYIIERKHLYRFTFQTDPATDGYVFLSANRGCVNQRCWVLVDDIAYMLDEAGVHAFSGGEESEPLSIPIQDLFESEALGMRDLRINWSARRFFHASYYPGQEVIRWFVALSGHYLPRHALCFDIRQKRWWLEEFSSPIGSSSLGRLNGEPKVFLGGPAGRVFAYAVGGLDQASELQGTVRGSVTSSTPTSLTDTSAIFSASGLAGAPLIIVSGRGKGQRRLITAVAATTLTINAPWITLPDTTSTYQVGGVQWRYRTGYFRFVESEDETPRRLEIIFEPVTPATTLDARLYLDRSQAAVGWGSTYSSSEANGFASTENETDLVADLTKALGFVQKRVDGHRELYIDGPRFVTLELAGVSNSEQVVIYQVTLDGVESGR